MDSVPDNWTDSNKRHEGPSGRNALKLGILVLLTIRAAAALLSAAVRSSLAIRALAASMSACRDSTVARVLRLLLPPELEAGVTRTRS